MKNKVSFVINGLTINGLVPTYGFYHLVPPNFVKFYLFFIFTSLKIFCIYSLKV